MDTKKTNNRRWTQIYADKWFSLRSREGVLTSVGVHQERDIYRF